MYGITTRNATLQDLVSMLQDQQIRKHDFVTPASRMHAENGYLIVTGSEPLITSEGVTENDGRYRPTAVFDEGAASALKIPAAYLKRLRDERPDLYDANINGWLLGDPNNPTIGADPRSFLIRAFKPDNDGVGYARALLSDRYGIIDNLDVLTAALDGVRQAGVEVDVTGGDLSERRMVLRVSAPDVKALAPSLLRGYRSPFTGESGTENPTVFAGFVLSNSEVGNGAFTITPRVTVEVCSNGMTITRDAMRSIHLGGRMDEGVIRWSQETMAKQLELVTLRAKDAVATFCDTGYVEKVLVDLDEAAGRPVETVDAVRDVSKSLGFSQEHSEGVLTHFIKGGQMTRGGVMHAITAYTQTIDDADTAYDMEAVAVRALTI